ncbi:MAG TPA: methyltransferase domain-containing protein [Allosphingosinicella sp.]|nr:methyltransferase domain-containing protein [Allosphingosinicella sp.]
MDEEPFDRRLRRLRRARAAKGAAEADYLLRHAADELIERLQSVRRKFDRALVLGCVEASLAARLEEEGMSVVSADPGATPVDVRADEDRLPFAEGAFDLILSVGALDSVNDLPGALALIRRALRPDGLFLGAFAGAGSLPALRRAMQAAEEAERLPASPRIHPQIDLRAAGDLLARAGLALPVADGETLTVRFPSLLRLIADLRAVGATNMLASRSRRPLGRPGLAAAMAAFAAEADPDGKTPERFDIIYLTGWAPSPDQPRPAPRGSATASLAEALKRR